jgi:hypothetical protein
MTLNDKRIFIIACVIIGLTIAYVVGPSAMYMYLVATEDGVEDARIPNTSQTLEAVVLERGDATTPFFKHIHVVRRGSDVTGDPVVILTNPTGLSITWAGDEVLHIQAESVRLYQGEEFHGAEEAGVDGAPDKTVRSGTTLKVSNVAKIMVI